MCISMNVHDVAGINLTEIKSVTQKDGNVFYFRSISIVDKFGNELIRIDPISDDGHSLLINDNDLASIQEPLKMVA